jgi:hypothetical protein
LISDDWGAADGSSAAGLHDWRVEDTFWRIQGEKAAKSFYRMSFSDSLEVLPITAPGRVGVLRQHPQNMQRGAL